MHCCTLHCWSLSSFNPYCVRSKANTDMSAGFWCFSNTSRKQIHTNGLDLFLSLLWTSFTASSYRFWSLWPGSGTFWMKLTERPGFWNQRSPPGPTPWDALLLVPYICLWYILKWPLWFKVWRLFLMKLPCTVYLQGKMCPSKWRWIRDIQRCCRTVACWELSMVGRVLIWGTWAQMTPSVLRTSSRITFSFSSAHNYSCQPLFLYMQGRQLFICCLAIQLVRY